MTKDQYDAIMADATQRLGGNLRLRLTIEDGSYVQGKCSILGTDTVIVTLDTTMQVEYVDLARVLSIKFG